MPSIVNLANYLWLVRSWTLEEIYCYFPKSEKFPAAFLIFILMSAGECSSYPHQRALFFATEAEYCRKPQLIKIHRTIDCGVLSFNNETHTPTDQRLLWNGLRDCKRQRTTISAVRLCLLHIARRLPPWNLNTWSPKQNLGYDNRHDGEISQDPSLQSIDGCWERETHSPPEGSW